MAIHKHVLMLIFSTMLSDPLGLDGIQIATKKAEEKRKNNDNCCIPCIFTLVPTSK